MNVFCPECGSTTTLKPEKWCCDCGGAWEMEERFTFDPDSINATDQSIWRYGKLFGLPFEAPLCHMGTGWTPLLPLRWQERQVMLKLEYTAPTGSFKDRGTAVMVNILARQGANHIADDSSGNAGASVAAFAARFGMQADVFVPAHASPAKQAQISVYGARVHPVPGPRSNAKLVAREAATKGVTLASHAYHPGFLLGQQSVAWELWEQLSHRAPDWYVVPVGQGVHLLGVWLGFRRLLQAGLIEKTPRLVGVQPTLMAPLCRALDAGLETVPEVEASQPSIAEGLAIASPVRGRRLLEAIRASDGMCVSVQEDAIRDAQRFLARRGFYVEPTSATAVAALADILPIVESDHIVVVPLTGSGLKGTPKL